MEKRLLQEIRKSKRLMKIQEADIEGVDELVYNPVTGSGGEVGYGYDEGNKVEGLTWSGHENHLHMSFTDKEVAMKIIDKADEMGLITTENPYAKKDPNKQVDRVHKANSLHYQNFDGIPLVGKAVDIRGDKEKIVELIKWIESEFSKTVSSETDTKDDSETLMDKILDTTIGGKKIKDIISSETKPDSYIRQILSTLIK
jgi:hypothetical protein